MPAYISDHKMSAKKNSNTVDKILKNIDQINKNPNHAPFLIQDILNSDDFEFRGFRNQASKSMYAIVQVSFFIKNSNNEIFVIKRDLQDLCLKNHEYRINNKLSILSSFSPEFNIMSELNNWIENHILTKEQKIEYEFSYKGIALNKVPSSIINDKVINMPWYIIFTAELKLKNIKSAFSLNSKTEFEIFNKNDFEKLPYGDQSIFLGIQHKSTISIGSAKFIYRDQNSNWKDSLMPDCSYINEIKSDNNKKIQIINNFIKTRNSKPIYNLKTYLKKAGFSTIKDFADIITNLI